jgi:hypothetical protein
VHKGAYFVNKYKYFLLQDFCHFGKVADITESEDGAFFFTLYHGVHISFFDDIRANYFSTGTSEDSGQ